MGKLSTLQQNENDTDISLYQIYLQKSQENILKYCKLNSFKEIDDSVKYIYIYIYIYIFIGLNQRYIYIYIYIYIAFVKVDDTICLSLKKQTNKDTWKNEIKASKQGSTIFNKICFNIYIYIYIYIYILVWVSHGNILIAVFLSYQYTPPL